MRIFSIKAHLDLEIHAKESNKAHLKRLHTVFHATSDNNSRQIIMNKMERAHLALSLEHLCKLEGGKHFQNEAAEVEDISVSKVLAEEELVFEPDIAE